MPKLYFEDLVIGTVETYGTYAVTEAEVIEFASKYDPQPFHVDHEAAKSSVFGALCASGWHTCSMMMRMMVDHMFETGLASMGSPGIDELRWLKPVFPGDILSITSEFVSKSTSETRPNIGFAKTKFTVKNQHGEIKLTMIANSMIARKKPGT
jgi:acyl dehydratase